MSQAKKIHRFQSQIDLTVIKRDDLIQKEKLRNNMQDLDASHDHEHFDLMFAGYDIDIV